MKPAGLSDFAISHLTDPQKVLSERENQAFYGFINTCNCANIPE